MSTTSCVPSEPAPQAKGQVRDGLRYVRSEPDLWVPLVMMAIIGTFAFNFQVVIPLFVKGNLGGTDTTFTILYSVVAIGSLAAALASARRTSMANRDVVRGLGAVRREPDGDGGLAVARHGVRRRLCCSASRASW